MMAASLAVWGLFAWYEVRVQRAGGDPLIVPSLFRQARLQRRPRRRPGVLHRDGGQHPRAGPVLPARARLLPLKAGLAQIPWSVGVIIGFGVAQAVRRFGRKVIHAGTAIMAAGIAGTYATLQYAGIDVTAWQLVPALTVTGLGMGMLMAPFFDTVLCVEPEETGSAGGTLTAVQQLGSALGAAVLGTIFFGLLGGHVAAAADDGAPALRRDLAAASVPAPQQDRIVDGLRACGHDRATAKDAVAVPASCHRLQDEIGTAAPAVQKAVAQAGEHSAKVASATP